MGPMVPLTGYAPDADPATPGLVFDCANLIPTLRGMAGAPSGVAPAGVGVLAADCQGGAIVVSTTGTRRTFAGTQTKMYELVGTTWTDVSRVGNYVGSSGGRWSFAQFGNAAIASNKADAMQASTSGAFADIAGAPKARIVIGAPNFVLALSTNDGTYGDQSDRWWCSAFQDHTSWTPSVTTQATTGRLIGSGGELTAGLMLGQQAVAYKSRSMFVGTYVGPPVVWQWDQVPGDVGCIGPEAVCDIGGAHMFVGEDNIWLFDGTRPIPLADGTVRQWFLDNSSPAYRYRTVLLADRQNGRVWMFFPGVGSTDGTPTLGLVYHVIKKAWGRADMSIQAVMNLVAPGATIDGLTGTVDAMTVPFDSQYWLPGGRTPAVVNTSRQLLTLSGASTSSSLTTGDMGDDDGASMLRRARLRFITEPTSASVAGYIKAAGGKPLSVGGSGSLDDGKFDIRQSARWHRLAFSFTGAVEVDALAVDTVAAGTR